MGYCCTNRCLNTPHAWQMGWVSPQVLDGTSLVAAKTVTANFAAQTRGASSGLKIKPTWAGVASAESVYLGYR